MFDRAAFVVTLVLSKCVACRLAPFCFRLQLFLLGLAARIRVDNRHMSQRETVRLDLWGIIGAVRSGQDAVDLSLERERTEKISKSVIETAARRYLRREQNIKVTLVPEL